MEKYFYHVVTEKPMYVGQHIVFDENHHNGVWQRVAEKLDIVCDIYNNLEKYKDIELEHHTSVALRELALEKVRVEKYPNYPSRMACLYVSKTLEEAEKRFDYFTSTLTISPMKDAALLNHIGSEMGEVHGVKWLPSDFKKKNGYLRSCELSREYGIYRQDYCGCVFSYNERQKEKESFKEAL